MSKEDVSPKGKKRKSVIYDWLDIDTTQYHPDSYVRFVAFPILSPYIPFPPDIFLLLCFAGSSPWRISPGRLSCTRWGWNNLNLATGGLKTAWFGDSTLACTYEVNNWFQSLLSNSNLCRYDEAFNTFIDDVFAFAIAMPTIHRLAGSC